jgi:hypothetical protein
MIRFLLDENVDVNLRLELNRRYPEMIVWQIGTPGAPERSTLDPEILEWCEENEFSLVTNNRDSMPVHLQGHLETGRAVPGIFTLNLSMSFGETIDELILIWGAGFEEEFENQINYLPLRN